VFITTFCLGEKGAKAGRTERFLEEQLLKHRILFLRLDMPSKFTADSAACMHVCMYALSARSNAPQKCVGSTNI
jgi:hypothetical protein